MQPRPHFPCPLTSCTRAPLATSPCLMNNLAKWKGASPQVYLRPAVQTVPAQNAASVVLRHGVLEGMYMGIAETAEVKTGPRAIAQRDMYSVAKLLTLGLPLLCAFDVMPAESICVPFGTALICICYLLVSHNRNTIHCQLMQKASCQLLRA